MKSRCFSFPILSEETVDLKKALLHIYLEGNKMTRDYFMCNALLYVFFIDYIVSIKHEKNKYLVISVIRMSEQQ